MRKLISILFLLLLSSTAFSQTELGLARQIGPITDNQNGTTTATVTYTVQNFGVLPISNLQIVDSLQNQYAGATIVGVANISGPFIFDPTFNGTTSTNLLLAGSNSLPGSTTRTITLDVTVRPADDGRPFRQSPRRAQPPPTVLRDAQRCATWPRRPSKSRAR